MVKYVSKFDSAVYLAGAGSAGYFMTPLTKETLDSDWFTAYAKGAIPVGRYGNEGELDTCALFLASSASSYVNGQNIAVDGGYTAI